MLVRVEPDILGGVLGITTAMVKSAVQELARHELIQELPATRHAYIPVVGAAFAFYLAGLLDSGVGPHSAEWKQEVSNVLSKIQSLSVEEKHRLRAPVNPAPRDPSPGEMPGREG